MHIMEPDAITQQMNQVTAQEVERSLAKSRLDEQDLCHLLSPAAEPYLETMAQLAFQRTRQRFGKTMKLYAPLYLSNACSNSCVYCGFSANHQFTRKTLTIAEVEQQAAFLAQQGFQTILLVSGESRQEVSLDYIAACIAAIRPRFPEISIEIYPLETAAYRQLADQGLYGLVVYQETYAKDVYHAMHPSGQKKLYDFRLATPARGAAAGLRQIGLGVLLGLSDFRSDAFHLGVHALALQKNYWRSAIGLSFPRITAAAGGFKPPHPVSDKNLVQMVTALRLFLPDAPFSLSTREPHALRKNLLPLGFTQMSAGSCTEPGGYGQPNAGCQQFKVEDTRSAAEIARELDEVGLEPVWKDWDRSF